MELELREERPADEAAVRELHIAAFGDEGAVVAALVDALRTGPDVLSLVAVDQVAVEQGPGEGDRVVGHVMFTRSLLDAPRRLLPVQVLSPLAVLPARHRAGIGSALVRRGLELLAERPEPLVFLEGSPDYYPRFGFVPGGDLRFRKPSLRIPDASFQVLRLPAYEPWMTGTLVYNPLFWEFDAVGLRDPEAL